MTSDPSGEIAPSLPVIPSLALLSFLLYLFYNYIIWPLLFSPLRRIPSAHPTAPYSSFWINFIRHRFRENQTLFNAHQHLGPVIRLGPHELSVNCVDNGIRTIYAGGFEKHEWYPNLFSNFDGVPVMFSTAHSVPHSGRKRMMTNAYAKSTLQTSATLAIATSKIIYSHLLPLLQSKDVASEPVNVRRILECVTMDIVTAYLFGFSSASDFLNNPEEAEWWLRRYQSRKAYTFWPQEMPQISSFASRLGLQLSPLWVAEANHELECWTLKLCDAAETQLTPQNEKTYKEEDKPVVYQQLRSQLEKESQKSSAIPLSMAPHRIQIASEMLDHLSAGHETSSITLTFLLYELALRPSLQLRLKSELSSLEPRISLHQLESKATDSSQPPLTSFKLLDSLPLLHSILMETLRLHQAIPGPQPRVTPKDAQLGPYTNLPANLRVSANAFCLHRNPDVFPCPESWIPERWAQDPQKDSEKEDHRLKEMHRWFWAFGSGGRMCIGSNLAILQMKLIVAAVVSCFRVELVSLDKEEMPANAYNNAWSGSERLNVEEPLPDAPFLGQEDAYTAQPVAKNVSMRLRRW